MNPRDKKILRAISLELRHLLVGYYRSDGQWQAGDLEQRLASIGVRRDREPIHVDELAHLSDNDKNARSVVDAYLQLREKAGVSREEAVAEFVRETAHTWANRLLCLRCMEARELIDEVILQKEAYGGRSLEHHRLVQRQPDLRTREDDGLFAVLDKVFAERAGELPLFFNPQAVGVALKPSPAVLKRCLSLLSGIETVRGQERITAEVFQAPGALGWAYQYWNIEEKERVFEKVRTQKGAKIAGADIIPATQLYTEPYMVKFLVQNSLGAAWMGMHADSKLCDKWEYYVRDADRAPVERKPVAEITFLDPACGSGHFLLEAFDLCYDMYEEEGELTEPEDICRSILEKNLFGIDIDARAVQIAEAALWMKAAERAFDFEGGATNLIAAAASHFKGDVWEEFLAGFEREPSVARVLRKFGQAMEDIDELGSLARPDEELRAIIREEHAVWGRQIREQREADYLFPEMTRDALSGQLPFHETSDEEFEERLLYRARAAIDDFTVKAREEEALQNQFSRGETVEGFKFLDLLSRKYDVVAANPPFMGSKNMSSVLKGHLELHYKAGKRDLYAAFILRSRELADRSARIAMVTQQSWLFLRSFSHLRVGGGGNGSGENAKELGLLSSTSFECLVHLGRYAFSEIGNAAVAPVLFVFREGRADSEHTVWACRLSAPRQSEEQSSLLAAAIQEGGASNVFRSRQSGFSRIPDAPICYWLRPRLLDLLAGPGLDSVAAIHAGLCTGADKRFTRFQWEAPPTEWAKEVTSRRWVPFEKGAGYGKWFGHNYWVVDWEQDGSRLRAAELPGTRIQNERWYFRSGWTYSYMASGSFALRSIGADTIVSHLSSGVYFAAGARGLAALMNCRLSSMAIRSVSAKTQLNESYVGRIPAPVEIPSQLPLLEEISVRLKQQQASKDLTERCFIPRRVRGTTTNATLALLLTVEGFCEQLAFKAYGVNGEDLDAVLSETGTPAAWFPLISGYDTMPAAPCSSVRLPPELSDWLGQHQRRSFDVDERHSLIARLRTLYEAGPGANVELENEPETSGVDEDYGEDCGEAAVGARVPIPAESHIEELARQLKIHPISVYRLLEEHVAEEGWRCYPEERRLRADWITVAVLRLLGHRWPTQIEAGEAAPEWADPDGIIPLSEGTDEATLPERLRDRIAAEFEGGDAASIEREFAEILGKPLERWLSMEFFKHHTRQFKRRPIAWQIQSGKFTARKKPAFACVVYYHKLDGDLLPKIRTQYVGALRQRMETELRNIEVVSADARSDRQESRRVELEAQMDELRDFDAALQTVIREGFASMEVTKIIKDEPLDKWCAIDDARRAPEIQDALLQQESRYSPDINDGVRVNIAPLQKAGLLAADVLAKKDLDKAIADRAQWRGDERRWRREPGKGVRDLD